jgi:uncharacterized phage protein gp47/JayE
MFEEYTFESIMESMMADMPDGVDTSEGSQIWHSCAKIAVRLEEAYGNLGYVWENILVDTQDLEHLIASGTEAGYPIIEARPATFSARLNIPVEQGTILTHSEEDFNYVVVAMGQEPDEGGMYSALVECEEAGAEPNSIFGEIEPVDYMEEFEAGELTALITAGEDQEDEEAYRQRRLEYVGSIKPFGGNRAYYLREIGNLTGVGGVKVYRRTEGTENIVAVIQSAGYGVPSPGLIASVQEAVDPVGDTGEGLGIAPINHSVLIEGVTPLTVDVTASAAYDSGYSFAELESQILAAIDGYLLSINEAWQDGDQLMVRIAHIEARLLGIEGIIDVSETTLNGIAANLPLGANEAAVRGDVQC